MTVYSVLQFPALSQLSTMTAIWGLFGPLALPFNEGKMCPVPEHRTTKVHIGSGDKTPILNFGASG
jgi:hypothetical protein